MRAVAPGPSSLPQAKAGSSAEGFTAAEVGALAAAAAASATAALRERGQRGIQHARPESADFFLKEAGGARCIGGAAAGPAAAAGGPAARFAADLPLRDGPGGFLFVRRSRSRADHCFTTQNFFKKTQKTVVTNHH